MLSPQQIGKNYWVYPALPAIIHKPMGHGTAGSRALIPRATFYIPFGHPMRVGASAVNVFEAPPHYIKRRKTQRDFSFPALLSSATSAHPIKATPQPLLLQCQKLPASQGGRAADDDDVGCRWNGME